MLFRDITRLIIQSTHHLSVFNTIFNIASATCAHFRISLQLIAPVVTFSPIASKIYGWPKCTGTFRSSVRVYRFHERLIPRRSLTVPHHGEWRLRFLSYGYDTCTWGENDDFIFFFHSHVPFVCRIMRTFGQPVRTLAAIASKEMHAWFA